MRRLRPYAPLALLLTFVLGSRPQCEQRAGSETYAPVALRLPGSACVEVADPGGRNWDDLTSATLVDTFESIWLRVERRATGNRVFVCSSDDVPLQLGLPVRLEVVRDTGETGSGLLNLDTGNLVGVTAWADPPAVAAGDTARLHLDVTGGTRPYTYRWVGNVSDPESDSPTVYGPGRYYVWVFDQAAAGKTEPLHYDWTMVVVNAILPDTFATAAPDTIDPGGSATLGLVPPPRSAWWSPGADLNNPYTPTPVASPTHSTDYTAVAIYDGPHNLGVRLTVRLSVDATANPMSITTDGYAVVRATGISGGQIYPGGNYTYVWSPAHGIDNNVFGQSRVVRPTQTTTYTVHVIDGFGQLAVDTVTVEVRP